MSTISGQTTTFNSPNYHGELITLTPTETPLLSMAGGLSGGGETTDSPSFEWQTVDLRTPSIRTRLEGANAPTAEGRARSNVENVVQIVQENVETSYTKQAATGQYTSPSSAPFYTASGGANPVASEHDKQVMWALTEIAKDLNYTFWNGVKVKPTTNGTARATDGLLNVITSNALVKSGNAKITAASSATDTITSATHGLSVGDKVVFTAIGAATNVATTKSYWVTNVGSGTTFKVATSAGGTALTLGTSSSNIDFFPINAADTVAVDDVNTLLQSCYDNGGITNQTTATLFVNSGMKIKLTKAYASAYGQTDPLVRTRNVGGVAVNTIVTDFGELNVVMDRDCPQDALVVASMEQVSPVFLNIPGKGFLFEEALAKVGSADRTQIYGEVGLKYGNQAAHGVYRGFFA